MPYRHRYRAAHRIADRDTGTDTEHIKKRHGIVGSVLEPEPIARTDASTMATVIESYDIEVFAKRRKHVEPVEVGVYKPPVKQKYRRSAGWPFEMAKEGLASARKVDGSARWKIGSVGHRRGPTIRC